MIFWWGEGFTSSQWNAITAHFTQPKFDATFSLFSFLMLSQVECEIQIVENCAISFCHFHTFKKYLKYWQQWIANFQFLLITLDQVYTIISFFVEFFESRHELKGIQYSERINRTNILGWSIINASGLFFHNEKSAFNERKTSSFNEMHVFVAPCFMFTRSRELRTDFSQISIHQHEIESNNF